MGQSTEPKPSLDRPKLRAGTKQQIEAEAFKDENGNFTDANGNVLTDWQYGHRPSVENRRILKAANEVGMTQPELNDFVNEHPEYYQIEDRLINLSRVNEKPGNDGLREILEDMEDFLEARK
ncbi:GH-E family nuclease [Vibrio sp. PP-XX7]